MHPALGNLDTFKSAFAEEVSKVRLVESSIPKLKFRRQLWSRLTKNPALGRTLGAGAFGRVFELKSNRHAVVKIGLENRFDGWFYWAVAAKMLSHNPFMPRIGDIAFGIHFPRGTSANDKEVLLNKTRKNIKLIGSWENQHRAVGYAVMEKLQPIDSNANWHVIDLIESMTGGRQNVRDQKIDKLINPDFAEALVAVDRCLSFTGGGHDIHGGNIMLRGQQFVITDPIC